MSGNAANVTENLMTLLAILIFTGVVCVKISKSIPIPDVVLFIVAGIILGPSFLNILDFDHFTTGNHLILTFGAAYILYDGGREVQLHVLNKVKTSVFTLATVGVLVSSFITGFFAYKILNIDFMSALLLGSVIASTDPSVLVPLFKKINISNKVKQTIISESAFNDAAGAIITFSIIGIIQGGNFSLGNSVIQLIITAGGGIIVGLLVGYAISVLLSDKKYNFLHGHSAEVVIASILGSYVIAQRLGFSGFMATFMVGMVCGNKQILNLKMDKENLNLHVNFKDTFISLLRIMIFITLGTQIDFVLLGQYWIHASFVILLFIFVARPVSVFISVILDKKAEWKLNEVLYLMWTRETGVIPAALSGMIISLKINNAPIISAVTFMAIIITLTFQASTAKYVAKLLKLELDVKVE
ncbi:sodium:proton antiporter [Clostridium algoriphilum]|uniref:cation:proton antiporter n=1 Tax=Clostridium algoriphilum TaxID=198347 RepID=UPI001CF5FD07|nr:sodium:proton antiporter [Clostridium algoriphilum]MCB2295132.1 sodium:proton antiporter [Clostridium algoriphilum]